MWSSWNVKWKFAIRKESGIDVRSTGVVGCCRLGYLPHWRDALFSELTNWMYREDKDVHRALAFSDFVEDEFIIKVQLLQRSVLKLHTSIL